MRLAAALLALAACGAPDVGPDGVDAGAGDAGVQLDAIACAGTCELPDAAPAPDGSLGDGADCDPLLDECASGLTCRIVDVQGGAECRPVGPLEAGGDCEADGDAACGYAMQCTPVGAGRFGCVVVCDINSPTRCADGETCWPFIGDDIGFCQ